MLGNQLVQELSANPNTPVARDYLALCEQSRFWQEMAERNAELAVAVRDTAGVVMCGKPSSTFALDCQMIAGVATQLEAAPVAVRSAFSHSVRELTDQYQTAVAMVASLPAGGVIQEKARELSTQIGGVAQAVSQWGSQAERLVYHSFCKFPSGMYGKA